MSEVQSSRRMQAKENLGLSEDADQTLQLERSIHKEEKRRSAKEEKRHKLEESFSYRTTKFIASAMDKYFIDPLLGFIPGAGDFISSICVLPFIYVAAVKVRSLPLTLAVIYNVLVDVAIGLIPFWVGNVLDFFVRAYVKNMRLIVGYVEDDKEVINEVNRKAVWTAVLIAVFCVIIYFLVRLAVVAVEWIKGLFA